MGNVSSHLSGSGVYTNVVQYNSMHAKKKSLMYCIFPPEYYNECMAGFATALQMLTLPVMFLLNESP